MRARRPHLSPGERAQIWLLDEVARIVIKQAVIRPLVAMLLAGELPLGPRARASRGWRRHRREAKSRSRAARSTLAVAFEAEGGQADPTPGGPWSRPNNTGGFAATRI